MGNDIIKKNFSRFKAMVYGPWGWDPLLWIGLFLLFNMRFGTFFIFPTFVFIGGCLMGLLFTLYRMKTRWKDLKQEHERPQNRLMLYSRVLLTLFVMPFIWYYTLVEPALTMGTRLLGTPFAQTKNYEARYGQDRNYTVSSRVSRLDGRSIFFPGSLSIKTYSPENIYSILDIFSEENMGMTKQGTVLVSGRESIFGRVILNIEKVPYESPSPNEAVWNKYKNW